MTNKSFFYKTKNHVSKPKCKCECKDVIDRMNEEIENLQAIIRGINEDKRNIEKN